LFSFVSFVVKAFAFPISAMKGDPLLTDHLFRFSPRLRASVVKISPFLFPDLGDVATHNPKG
jgi:hypothetical protein